MSAISVRGSASADSRTRGLTLPDGTLIQAQTLPSGNWRIEALADADRMLSEPPAPESQQGTITWYVPYTKVHPRTVGGAPVDAIWIDVSSSPFAYYEALRQIWQRGETFAVLEHDVVCRPDIIEAFETSPEPWMACGYDDICHRACMDAWANMLGCTRFDARLIRAVPDAMESIPEDGWDWHNVCDGLGRNLRAAGFAHRWYFPPAEHHHLTDGVHGPQNQWWM